MSEKKNEEKYLRKKIGVNDIWWLITGAFVRYDKNKYER